jgi:hypothetical protein
MLTKAIERKKKYYSYSEFPTYGEIAGLPLELAKCYLEEGNMQKAEHYIKLSLRGNDVLPEAATKYADLLKDTNRTKESRPPPRTIATSYGIDTLQSRRSRHLIIVGYRIVVQLIGHSSAVLFTDHDHDRDQLILRNQHRKQERSLIDVN